MSPLELPGSGIQSALLRTAEADKTLRYLLRKHKTHAHNIAILGVGGYGRSDNTLRSDLDLIILFREDIADHEDALKNLVKGLWDYKWVPAQSLVSLEEINADLLAIPDRASAILESRLIWGDTKLVEDLEKKLNRLFNIDVWAKFINLKYDEYLVRRKKYGEVVRVIEPHLKSQVGGLRDLHHVYWIERARIALDGKWSVGHRRTSSISSFINRMKSADYLDLFERNDILSAFDLMLRCREALRRITKREEDILTVERQPEIGKILGFEDNQTTVMKQLMRSVSGSMEKISRFSEEFGSVLTTFPSKSKKPRQQCKLLPGSKISNHRLFLDLDHCEELSKSPSLLLNLSEFCYENRIILSGESRHKLRREIQRYWLNRDDIGEWHKPIKELIANKRGVGSRLRWLNDIDAIHPWLPEWREVYGLTTGSYYHTYLVDEHTLRAIEGLDELPGNGPEGLPQSLWNKFQQREWIYAGILFHDIAKGFEGDHSEEGERIAENALTRLGFVDMIEPVTMLVRMHLMMEQVAFRRDASDPDNVMSFANQVKNTDLLGALYILTVCDLRAVSRGVWTEWKGRLLSELYLSTRDWFKLGPYSLEPSVDEEAHVVAQLMEYGEEREYRAKRFLEQMRVEYRRVVPAKEVAQHFEVVEEIESGTPFRWLILQESGYVILTIITRDRIGLLANIVGMLVSQGIGIREARIFTREDGIVIDRFRAEDIMPDGVPFAERLNKIHKLWDDVVSGDVKLEQLIENQRKRRTIIPKRMAVVESEVHFNRTENGWIVDVSGPDSTGLLYKLCREFSASQLDVRAARVTGRIDGIHDSFLLNDDEGILDSKSVRRKLVNRLEEVISEQV